MEEKQGRRSSILKPQKRRNPLAALDFTGNVGSEDHVTESIPASRLSRRVSFANLNTVKQFAADPDKNTIWDTTYEELANSTESTGSGTHLQTMGEVSSVINITDFQKSQSTTEDKSLTGSNDNKDVRIETTTTIQTNDKIVTQSNQKRVTRSSNKIITIQETVDVHTECNKYTNTNKENAMEVSMELTEAVPTEKLCNANITRLEEMEFTQPTTSIIKKRNSKGAGKSWRNQTKLNVTYFDEDELMKSTTKQTNLNKTKINATVYIDDMELTGVAPVALKSARNSNISGNKSLNRTCFDNSNMDITQCDDLEIENYKTGNKTCVQDVEMEFTENVPNLCQDLNKSKNISKQKKSYKQLNSALLNKTSIESDDMEFTEAVPCSVQTVNPCPLKNQQTGSAVKVQKDLYGNKIVYSENTTSANKTCLQADDMEFTQNVPATLFKQSSVNKLLNTTNTKALNKTSSKALNRTNSEELNKTSFQMDDMDFTQAVPCSIQIGKLSGVEKEQDDIFEKDKVMNKHQLIEINQDEDVRSSNKTCDQIDDMEFTENIPSSLIKQSSAISSNVLNTTNTKILSKSKTLNQSSSEKLNKTSFHDEDMEFTEAVPVLDKINPVVGSEVKNKTETKNSIQDVCQPKNSEQNISTSNEPQNQEPQTNDMMEISMEFTQPIEPIKLDQNKIIYSDDTMEFNKISKSLTSTRIGNDLTCFEDDCNKSDQNKSTNKSHDHEKSSCAQSKFNNEPLTRNTSVEAVLSREKQFKGKSADVTSFDLSMKRIQNEFNTTKADLMPLLAIYDTTSSVDDTQNLLNADLAGLRHQPKSEFSRIIAGDFIPDNFSSKFYPLGKSINDSFPLHLDTTHKTESINISSKDGNQSNKAGLEISKSAGDTNKSSSGINTSASGINKSVSGINKSISGVNKSALGTNKSASGINKSTLEINKSTSEINKSTTRINNCPLEINTVPLEIYKPPTETTKSFLEVNSSVLEINNSCGLATNKTTDLEKNNETLAFHASSSKINADQFDFDTVRRQSLNVSHSILTQCDAVLKQSSTFRKSLNLRHPKENTTKNLVGVSEESKNTAVEDKDVSVGDQSKSITNKTITNGTDQQKNGEAEVYAQTENNYSESMDISLDGNYFVEPPDEMETSIPKLQPVMMNKTVALSNTLGINNTLEINNSSAFKTSSLAKNSAVSFISKLPVRKMNFQLTDSLTKPPLLEQSKNSFFEPAPIDISNTLIDQPSVPNISCLMAMHTNTETNDADDTPVKDKKRLSKEKAENKQVELKRLRIGESLNANNEPLNTVVELHESIPAIHKTGEYIEVLSTAVNVINACGAIQHTTSNFGMEKESVEVQIDNVKIQNEKLDKRNDNVEMQYENVEIQHANVDIQHETQIENASQKENVANNENIAHIENENSMIPQLETTSKIKLFTLYEDSEPDKLIKKPLDPNVSKAAFEDKENTKIINMDVSLSESDILTLNRSTEQIVTGNIPTLINNSNISNISVNQYTISESIFDCSGQPSTSYKLLAEESMCLTQSLTDSIITINESGCKTGGINNKTYMIDRETLDVPRDTQFSNVKNTIITNKQVINLNSSCNDEIGVVNISDTSRINVVDIDNLPMDEAVKHIHNPIYRMKEDISTAFSFIQKRNNNDKPSLRDLIKHNIELQEKFKNELNNFVIPDVKFEIFEEPEPDIELTSNVPNLVSADEIMKDGEMPQEKMTDSVDDEETLMDQIIEHQRRCEDYWTIKSLENNIVLETYFKTIELTLFCNEPTGTVCDLHVKSLISEQSTPETLFLHHLFLKRLDKKAIQLSLGNKYTTLSLLDYIQMTMDTMLDYYAVLKQLSGNYRFSIDENMRATFTVISIKICYVWKITIDLNNLDEMTETSVTAFAKCGKINEAKVKNLVQSCPKGFKFLSAFIQSVVKLMNMSEKKVLWKSNTAFAKM